MDSLQASDRDPDRLVSTPELAARGLTPHDIDRALADGSLVRLRRGIYATSRPDTPAERHRQRVRATVGELGDATVISHVSAAVWHGLEVPWSELGDAVHVSRQVGGGSRRSRLISHRARIPTECIVEIDGVRLTSVAWTVVDCARLLGFAGGLVVADSALRNRPPGQRTAGLRDRITAVLSAQKGRGAIAVARAVTAYASPLAESGGESVSRAVLKEMGIAEPVLQYEVRTPQGEFVARTDMGWPEDNTVGEFDGALKYGSGTTGGTGAAGRPPRGGGGGVGV
ncbi:type IV toxin-antitoxin system AbiEi family antitoxin domain-containing protein, partial [Raineyella sp.]|uniref:type IV toxin-antitoxin system AbiEi family antitoxin domain-containing protein n=1 Tax=Raineyella sp. TaxID=1911550 RepID=UPI002B1E955D